MKKVLLISLCLVQHTAYAQKDLTFFGEVGFVQPNLSSGTFDKTINNTTEHMSLQTAGGYTIGLGMKTLRGDTLQGIHFQLNAAFSSYYLTNNIKESIATYDAISQKTNNFISYYRYTDAVQYFKINPAVNGNYKINNALSIDGAIALILNTPLSRGFNMYVAGSATAGVIYKGIGAFASYEMPFGKLYKTYLDNQGVFSEFTPTAKQSTLIVGIRLYPAIFFKSICGCDKSCVAKSTAK
jgi:hypothetical protein